jgi:hypothetical protein
LLGLSAHRRRHSAITRGEALKTAAACAKPVGELAERVRAGERRCVQAMVSLDEERSDRIERVPSWQFAASDVR